MVFRGNISDSHETDFVTWSKGCKSIVHRAVQESRTTSFQAEGSRSRGQGT